MIRRTTTIAAAGLLALSAAAAQAQTVYRIVGPDGRVTFTDRAPENAAQGARVNGALQAGGAPDTDALPYALRQSAQRYPVVLYTGADCAPCVSGRNLLVNRGIPFAERTVSTNDDIDALKRLAGDSGLPLLTIGGQQLKGFSDTEWSQYLDAAGYPRQSQLPAGYRHPAAAPLVARSNSVVPSGVVPKPEPARAAPAAPAPGGATPSNPAGIVF